MKKKVIAMGLSSVLALSALSDCDSNHVSPETQTQSTTQADAQATAQESKEITLFAAF